MAIYWLTFRLQEDADYDDRYQALVDAIQRITTRWWVEPSSFMLFESSRDIDGVAASVKAAIAESKDLVLIGMPDYKTARLIGKSDDDDIFKLMPFTKRA
jgi:hypothetical protein